MASASSRSLELKVGLLIVGGLVALVAIILISDRFTLDDYYRVTAFLPDAGGLRKNAPVTLAGVPIGSVESISTESNKPGYPIRVEMKINEDYLLPSTSTLQVATSGIFGDSYLAFSANGAPTEDVDLLPTNGSAVVHATRGFIDEATEKAMTLLTSVNDLLGDDSRANAKRLLKHSADLAGQAAALAGELRAEVKAGQGLLTEMRQLTAELLTTTKVLNQRADAALVALTTAAERGAGAAGAAQSALTRADQALAAGQEALAENRVDLRGLIAGLRALSDHAAAVAADLRAGKGVVGQLLVNQDMAKDVNELTINLLQASELIVEHPEALVFGTSTENRIHLREQREKRKMRRSFAEGFYRTPKPVMAPPTLLDGTAKDR